MHKCLGIYHTNVHVMLRHARGPVQLRGNRAIHLIHSLFSSADIQMLEHVRIKKYPSADEVSLKLLEKGKQTPTTVKLSEALARFEPLSYLVQTKAGTEETPGTYKFLKFNDPALPQNQRKAGPMSKRYYKRRGRSKETHLNTDCPPALLRHKIKLAYSFLLEGSRMEFHLRSKAAARAESVDSALRRHLHLRPDAILAAMPPGTTMLALPGTTQPPDKELERNSKLFANKTSDVFWAMENGPALKRLNLHTSSKIKKLGTWTNHQKYIQTVRDEIQEIRRRKIAKREARDEQAIKERMGVRFRMGRGTEDADLPHLSDLMPKEGRDGDGSSGSDAPATSGYLRFTHPRRKIKEVDTR